MNFKNLLHAMASAALLLFFTGCNRNGQAQGDAPAPPAARTAEEVVSGMRLKQLTKVLDLTDDQKAQVKTLLDAETKEIQKLHEDSNLTPTQNAIRTTEIQKATYEKIRPLLTPAQVEKLDKSLAKRKKN